MSRYETLLDEVIKEVLEKLEIPNAPAPQLIRNRLKLRIQDERQNLLKDAAESIASADHAENDLKDALAIAKNTPVPRPIGFLLGAWSCAGAIVVVAALLILSLLTRGGHPLFGLKVDVLPDVGLFSLVFVAIVICAFLFIGWVGFFVSVDERRAKWVANREVELEVPRLKSELEAANRRLRNHIEQEVVLPFLRGEIRQLAPPPDSTTIPRLDRAGLVEIHDLQFQVLTPAHKQLSDLIAETRAGTIGVSGSRGAGKTTLLRYFCRPDLPNSPLEERRLRVQVHAPVEYEARDFVLHIFSELCYATCEILGVDRSAFRSNSTELDSPQDELRAQLYSTRFLFRLRLIRVLLLIVASLLLLLSGMGLYFEFAPTQATATHLVAGETGREADANSVQVGSNELAADRAAQFRAFLRSNKSTLLHYGFGALLMVFLTRWAGQQILTQREQWISTRPSWHRPRIDFDSLTARWRHVFLIAAEHLENIHFQQSFSSGWKGSLGLSTLSFDQSLVQSLTARQQSLPEIIADFRKFIGLLPLKHPAIIAIDELDKMAGPERAERFLNDIKSIFGVPGCVYLISVSAQAMSRFKSRGFTVRDTFDSSFDEVVHVRYFDLKQSSLLLNRRVIGLPDNFHILCHLLSGGLPRDLIRACRTLLTIRDAIARKPDSLVSLRKLSKRMVLEEVRSTFDALQVEFSGEASRGHAALILEPLKRILTQNVSLVEEARIIHKLAEPRQLKLGLVQDNAAQRLRPPDERVSSEAVLWQTLASLFLYLGTVEELMLKAAILGTTPSVAVVNELAEIRPEIGMNPEWTWDRIMAIRQIVFE